MISRSSRISCFVLLLLVSGAACAQDAAQTVFLLKYKLVEKLGSPFFCDKDKWPVPRPEAPRAQDWFAQTQINGPEFTALSNHLNLNKPADRLQPEEIMRLYREHKMLDAIRMDASGANFSFSIRTGKFGEQGEAISGVVSAAGEITVQKREAVGNTCPKCLAEGALIDTPKGEVAVQDLRQGMAIWTLDSDGSRIPGVVQSVVRVPVPPNHEVVRMELDNGRVLLASPEHPLPDGRSIGRLQTGDAVYGIRIMSAARVRYGAEFTYDVLPSGPTGYYWAEGVLLASTISR